MTEKYENDKIKVESIIILDIHVNYLEKLDKIENYFILNNVPKYDI